MDSYEWVWTDDGLASADRNGVTTTEVMDALLGAGRHVNRLSDEMAVFTGLARTGRLIAVLCTRLDRVSPVMRIRQVRAGTDQQREEWLSNG